MALFPQLGPGILTQLPYVQDQVFLTGKVELSSGYRKTYAWRSSPLGRWSLSFANITPAELVVLEAFVDSMNGPLGNFTFLDPAGNQLPNSDVADASWSKNAMSVGALGQSDPFGGTNAQLMTSSGDGYVNAQCFVDDVVGWVVSGAVWLKLQGGSPLNVLVSLSTQTLTYSVTVRLVAGVWTRVDVTALLTEHVSGAHPALFQIGGASSIPNTSQVMVYCPQVSTMGLCGGVVRSPQNYGRHVYCRFDDDVRQVSYPSSPGSRQVQLAVQEIHL